MNPAFPRAVAGWPPGPRGNLFFGHQGALRRDRLGFLAALARDYGDFVPLRFRGRAAVFVSDPDLIETMLFGRAADYSKNNLSDFFNPALRRLLLFEESTSWLEQRHLAQPALRPDRLPSYAKVMVACAERMCDTFEDTQNIDVAQSMRRLTLDILAKSLFDVDLADIAAEAPHIFDAILDDVGARAFSPIYLSFLPTGSNWRARARFKRGQELVNDLIARRRLEPDGRDDLLSALIGHRDQDGRALTDDEIKLTIVPLFFAGHETTATALTWALYLLASNRELERRLHAELESTLGSRAVSAGDLPRLQFGASVVHETLRLYPPIWGFGRQAIRDTELGPYRIPSGTTLFASQWVLHRDPRNFEDPLRFQPDRWSHQGVANLSRCAFMPFGAGPRRCIGSAFAIQEAVLVLATLLRRFQVATVPGSEPGLEPLITLRTKGLHLEVKRRVAVGI